MLKEFKEFAIKGNVIDMAVGIIIGTAFGKIVASFVNDVIMPPLGLLAGGMDFSKMAYVLKRATETSPEVAIKYGLFLNAILNFLIIGWAIFLAIKILNSAKKKEVAPPPAPDEKNCPECLLTIPLKAKRCGHCATPVSTPT